MTLQQLIQESCRRFRHRIALSYTDEEPISYGDLEKHIEDLSAFLRNQGVEHGDRVAVLGENSPNWGIAFFAIQTIGAIAVPILPDFHSSEIHHILRHSESKVVFISERFYYKIEEFDLTKFSTVILLNDFSILNPDIEKATLRQLIAEGGRELRKIKSFVLSLAGLIHKEVREDDIASIIYTSGTTGHSKGVMLTHKNIVWNAQASARIPKIDENDRMLSVLPLAHVYECTLGLVLPLMLGGSVYYVKKPPTAGVLLPALEKVRPTAMLTVPLIIEKMYRAHILPAIKKHSFMRLMVKVPMIRKRVHKFAGKKLMATFGSKMRFFGIGGAALSPEVERFLREAEFPYAIGYGLTETSPLIAGTNAETTKLRSTGPVIPGVEVRIDNPDPKSGIGEIVVRGPGVMKGYYRDSAQTSEVLSTDGWFRTGDLGTFDAAGNLYITGRLKNVILGPSGENIYPEAIESVINRSEYVLESLVYMDNGQLIARIHLDYEKLDNEFSGQNLSEFQTRLRIAQLLEEIRQETNENVSSFSRIAHVIEQTEPFEKTPTQKIKRYLYAI